MTLPLPDLDDRNWADLVEEGRALIPLYDPGWTDHNIHDPGIMLLELLAWITEGDIYRVNRVPESHHYRFLALAGFHPRPLQPAQCVIAVKLAPGAAPVRLPAGLEFGAAPATDGDAPLFSTMHDLTAIPGEVVAVQREEQGRLVDLTDRFRRGEAFAPFGADPTVTAALYVGLSDPLPPGVPAILYFSFEGEKAGYRERERIERYLASMDPRCRPGPQLWWCEELAAPAEAPGLPPVAAASPGAAAQAGPTAEPLLPIHHSAELAWEYLDDAGRWRPLRPDRAEVLDETRSATLCGRVTLRVPGAMGARRLGGGARCFWLRVRLVAGAFDDAPSLKSLVLNGVLARQAVARTTAWTILGSAVVTGPAPAPGDLARFQMKLDGEGRITELAFGDPMAPERQVLDFQAPASGARGRLAVTGEELEPGTGRPGQRRLVGGAPLIPSSLDMTSWEAGAWRSWQVVEDLAASGGADLHLVADAATGELRFGDGEHGRVPPPGARLCASYSSTLAENGNLPAGSVSSLPDSPRNRALVGDVAALRTGIAVIDNPLPAGGGQVGESLSELKARALAEMERPTRAVTLDDCRTLALELPGVSLARAQAIASRHPAYPCLQAPGIVTLIVMPKLPLAKPRASSGLLRAVQAELNERRVIGTQIVVAGPAYRLVTVQASVQAEEGADAAEVRTAVEAALARFFHPLTGGPDGNGWPFGRSVFRGEVLQAIDETPGVDHVLSLALIGEDGQPQCGNMCLGLLEVVEGSHHQVEVISDEYGEIAGTAAFAVLARPDAGPARPGRPGGDAEGSAGLAQPGATRGLRHPRGVQGVGRQQGCGCGRRGLRAGL